MDQPKNITRASERRLGVRRLVGALLPGANRPQATHVSKAPTSRCTPNEFQLRGPEPVVVSEDHSLSARPNTQLVKEIRNVIAHRLFADR